MITYVCDACFESVEHDGPHLPPRWVAIVARIDWGESTGGPQIEQECNARLLCSKCRGENQDKLCARVERLLSNGLDQRPRPAAGVPA